MSYVRTLLAKLGFEVDTGPIESFNEEIDDSKRLLDDVKDKAGGLMTRLASLNQVWELTGKVAGSVWSTLKSLTLDVAAAGNAISDTSQQIGVNTTELGRLQFAAESTGSSADTMTKALLEQQKQMRETSMNGATPFGKALEELGLKLEDISHLSAEDRLGALGDRLGRVADEGRRTALSMALFGGEGGKMLPTIVGGTDALRAMGDEGERLGYVMSESTIAAAAELEGTFESLSHMVQGVKNDIAAALMPTITELAGELAGWIKNNKELIAENVKGFIEGLISAGKTLGPIIMTAAKAVSGLVGALGGVDKALPPVLVGLAALRIASMAALGPFGLIAAAALAAGVAIVNAMSSAKKAVLDTNRAAMRLHETMRLEGQLEDMSTQQLEDKQAEIAAARARNQTIKDARGMSPKEIRRQNAEREADLAMLDEMEGKLNSVLSRKKKEAKGASDGKYAALADERKAADDKAAEEEGKGFQLISDTEELRGLRRKKGKSQADRDRIKELEKAVPQTGGGGGKKAAAEPKQKTVEELLGIGDGANGIMNGNDAPGMGTKMMTVIININQDNNFGPFQLPGYAVTSPQEYGKAVGTQIAADLDGQNRAWASYLQGSPRSGAKS